jgi:phosphate-selective porin OprO/OprP
MKKIISISSTLAVVLTLGAANILQASEGPEVGGRIHFDFYDNMPDQTRTTGGTEFRRARLQIKGDSHGVNYVLHSEFTSSKPDLRDAFLMKKMGDTTFIFGQFKPFRSMDELTSSNNISVMERGFGSAAGIFNDRQWQQGLGFQQAFDTGSLSLALFSLREDSTARNEGKGAALRGTQGIMLGEKSLIHFGAWYSYEDGGLDTPSYDLKIAYGGRRGPETTLITSGVGENFKQKSAGVEFAGKFNRLHWQAELTQSEIDPNQEDIQTMYLQLGFVIGGSAKYNVKRGIFEGVEFVEGGLWEVVARGDRIKKESDGHELERLVVGVNRYISEDLRVMLNFTSGKNKKTADNPQQVALRTQLTF